MDEFIQQLGSKYDTSYDAGYVDKNGCDFIIDRAMKGAEQTFSVGQPVYDKDWNIMGWLGIGLFSSLNYGIKDVRVPVSYWKICLPTEFCEVGKKVYTYWQMKEKQMTNKDKFREIFGVELCYCGIHGKEGCFYILDFDKYNDPYVLTKTKQDAKDWLNAEYTNKIKEDKE